MTKITGSMTFSAYSHPYLSRPWDWLIHWVPVPYWYQPSYYSAVSPTVWGLIIPAAGYLVYLAVKRNRIGLFGIAWFAGTYLVWIPASLITDRISFSYYFYPAVGAVCLAIGYGIYQIRLLKKPKIRRLARSLAGTYLALHLALFIILSPLVSLW